MENIVRTQLRIPEDLYDLVKKQSIKKNTSMNGEIIHLLRIGLDKEELEAANQRSNWAIGVSMELDDGSDVNATIVRLLHENKMMREMMRDMSADIELLKYKIKK